LHIVASLSFNIATVVRRIPTLLMLNLAVAQVGCGHNNENRTMGNHVRFE